MTVASGEVRTSPLYSLHCLVSPSAVNLVECVQGYRSVMYKTFVLSMTNEGFDTSMFEVVAILS